jgi:hypothetical protein
MAIEQLQLKIGADISGVVTAVKTVDGTVLKLNNSLDALQQKLKAKQNLLVTEKDITKIQLYQAEIRELKQQLEKVSKIVLPSPPATFASTVQKSTSAIEGLSKGAGSAFSALRKLAYLIPGIGIAGLIGQFTELAITIFKGGNVLDFFSNKVGGSKKSVEDQAKAIREAKQAIENYVESLDDISKIKIEGAQDAQKELGALNTLYAASQNLSLSYTERKKAVDLLQERYPAYFANLSDEAILAGKAKAQYDKLTTSILAASTARAAQKELDTLAETARVIKQQREEAEKGEQAAKAASDAREAQNNKEIALAKKLGLSTLALENGIIDKKNESIKAQQKANGLRAQENSLLARQKKISEEIQGIIKENGVDVLKTTSDTKGEESADKKRAAAAKKAQAQALKDLKEYQAERNRIITEMSKDFAELQIFTLPDVGNPESNKDLFDTLHKRLLEEANRQLPVKIKLPVEISIEQDFDTGRINITEKLKEITSGIDPVKIKIPLKPTIVWTGTKLNDQLEDFGKIGNAIGERLGHGFGDVFQKIFEQSMSAAVMKGLSGDALENFKDGLVAVSVITSQAFDGLGDAFGNLTAALLTGKNAMQSFGESLKNTFVQLAAQLVKTIALAAILSLLTGGIGAKGGLSFLGAFKKILGFAEGGTVPGGVGTRDTVPAMLTPGEEVLTTKEAPIWRMFKKMLAIGAIPKMPKISNGAFHFNQGGTVPNIRTDSRAINRISNQINVEPNVFPTYLPAFSMTHDQFRLWYKRAETYGNNFGR